ncbi:MAG TPA: 3-deoxy-manno-octulosonate cytidylyltransferase [Legionellales bacterium]|nr:3-deoxy-manno-octulosonate cytidylyltransferase [Legionellales bacterium]HCA89234.1 3-deoxy-manno-octulosonate cytidylyltransferase [Legionellales bacterium]|tara:strand:+ start:699 stop:1499 length:801 start_codon:yes stop_codon:yes gene_type:complete
MKTIIIIPARFHSSRLPGKPLAKLGGQTMLERVVNIAKAVMTHKEVEVMVATEDKRIADYAATLKVKVALTRDTCLTGTDRVAEALAQLDKTYDLVINLQGDAPLTPPDFLHTMIQAFCDRPCDVITPVTQLSWLELEQLRLQKSLTPFSGTTALFQQETGRAYWFSKQILPAIRHEEKLKQCEGKSPVFRHIGLYGYTPGVLKRYVALPETDYERYEGLEQLRMIEQGFDVRCIPVEYLGRPNMSGIDSATDLARADALLKAYES